MYSAQANGADSATINPAALASDLANASRGVKRSRSPELYQNTDQQGSPGDDEGDKPRKRGRPMKAPGKPGTYTETPIQPPPLPAMSSHALNAPAPQPHPAVHHTPPQSQPARSYVPPPMVMPQAVAAAPVHATGGIPPPTPPTLSSPPMKTPVKTTLKALPTVRDHTTDQLGPGNDEYLPRETDDAGEKKVLGNGQLLGGREYRCRTFLVPQRGDKLFMLATECARVLGYRDSYLLFNKNRSLYKIIANQIEKDDLVGQEILPFSYRSRQIAIVTARSMFRQFGSRVIVGGRRVRDDYWETKARKQGFTEADMAGEKRPGGTKAREAAAEAAAAQTASLVGPSHGEIVYANAPQFSAAPPSQLVQPEYNDTRSRDYSNILKSAPRQEMAGPAYQDRSQPSSMGDIHNQAHQAAEFNRSVTQQRESRTDYMQSMWRRTHEQPPPPPSLTHQILTSEPPVQTSRAGTSAHVGASTSGNLQQSNLVSHQSPQMMMTAPPYSQPVQAQSSLPSSIQRPSGNMPQPQGYSYPPSTQMWPSTPQTPHTPQYSYSHPAPVQPSQPQGPSSSQLRHSSGSAPVQQGSMPYSAMPSMNPGYPSQSQQIPYDQTPRQYMQQPTSGPPVTQSWSGQPQQWWTNQQ